MFLPQRSFVIRFQIVTCKHPFGKVAQQQPQGPRKLTGVTAALVTAAEPRGGRDGRFETTTGPAWTGSPGATKPFRSAIRERKFQFGVGDHCRRPLIIALHNLPRALGAKRRRPARFRQIKCRSCCSTKEICRSRSRSVCLRASPHRPTRSVHRSRLIDHRRVSAQRETQQAEQRFHTHLKQVWADFTDNIEQIQPREQVPNQRVAACSLRACFSVADNEAVFKAMLPSARVKKMMQIENMMQERCGAAKFVRKQNTGGGARAYDRRVT